MIRLMLPLNKKEHTLLFAKSFLSSFKNNLLNSIDINKFNLRYDYLINNEILIFTNSFRMPSKKLINLIVDSFTIKYISKTKVYICLFDYKTIPNSNMSISLFVRFLEYGNFDMLPYPWIRTAWNKTLNQYKLNREVL